MNRIVLFAKASSKEEPYKVTFTYNDNLLSIFCDCPAGEFGQLCKHKIALATNNKTMLYDQEQFSEFQKVHKWVKTTGFSKAITEIRTIEKEIENLKKKLKGAKAKIARIMRDGG